MEYMKFKSDQMDKHAKLIKQYADRNKTERFRLTTKEVMDKIKIFKGLPFSYCNSMITRAVNQGYFKLIKRQGRKGNLYEKIS